MFVGQDGNPGESQRRDGPAGSLLAEITASDCRCATIAPAVSDEQGAPRSCSRLTALLSAWRAAARLEGTALPSSGSLAEQIRSDWRSGGHRLHPRTDGWVSGRGLQTG